MTLNQLLDQYKSQYNVIGTIDLDHWYTLKFYQKAAWLKKTLSTLYKESYSDNERIICVLTLGEEYHSDSDEYGVILETLQQTLN